jgi:hypothetical protein
MRFLVENASRFNRVDQEKSNRQPKYRVDGKLFHDIIAFITQAIATAIALIIALRNATAMNRKIYC